MANERYNAAVEIVKMLPTEERRQLINLLHDMSCAQCQNYTGSGCVLAGGKNPPAEIMAHGCKNFNYAIPF